MRALRWWPWAVVAAASLTVGPDQTSSAAPKPGALPHAAKTEVAASTQAVVLRDGSRSVQAWREGPPSRDTLGRRLAPVKLLYDGRSDAVSAAVDRSAIVQLELTAGRHERTARESLGAVRARVVRPLMPSIGLWLVEGDDDEDGLSLAARLIAAESRAAGVRQSFPNLYLHRVAMAPFVPNDPRLAGQWYFDKLAMTEAWGLERGEATTSIVVVDTGCDLAHVDLDGKLDPGRDVADEDDDPSADPAEDGASHGTACAGIVAAETDNAEGIAGGCPDCRLRCVRLLTDEAQPLSAEIEAFQFALDVDAAVVSNSWGYVGAVPVATAVADAVNNLFDNGRGGKGALVVFAAGNDDRVLGDDELTGVRGVLNVGAINNFDEQTPFTNYGPSLDLVAYTGTLTTDLTGAPGSDPTDYMSNFGGTSSACPVVAGIAGLLASAGTDHTAADLYQIMQDTARPAPYAQPDETGHDAVFGFGIVDPVAALRIVLDLPGPDEPPDGGDVDASTPPVGPPASDAGSDGGCSVRGARSAASAWAAPWILALAALAGRRRARRLLRAIADC